MMKLHIDTNDCHNDEPESSDNYSTGANWWEVFGSAFPECC